MISILVICLSFFALLVLFHKKLEKKERKDIVRIYHFSEFKADT